MPWGVAAAAVGVLGGMASANSAKKGAQMQSDAANKAAEMQLQSSRESNQLQADMYKSGLLQGAPYQQGGQLALSQLMSGLGLGGAKSAPGAGGAYGQQGVIGAGGGAPGTGYVNAQGQSTDAQGNVVFDPSYGISGLNYGATQQELDASAGNIESGYFNKAFTAEDLKAGMDPGYQFRQDQGNAALNARRAATGNRFGGQALKDITNYNQDLASQEYGNAYQRNLQQKSLLFDRLSGLAGIGQAQGNAASSAGQATGANMANTSMTAAGNASNYLTSGAAARAAGTVGSTNAIVGGANQGLNNYYSGQIMNKYIGGGSDAYANRPVSDSITLSDGTSFGG